MARRSSLTTRYGNEGVSMFGFKLRLADSTWLDLTPYVESVQIDQGIRAPNDFVAAPCLCQITLDNQDRRFTPNNTASPLYGVCEPGQAVIVQYDSKTLFVGYLRNVDVDSGRYGSQRAYFYCEDLLSRLQNTNISLPLQEGRRADELIRMITARVFNEDVA
ncbi:MAG: hypothetical protein CUN49_12040, partial [Candidatus Thermofonsia Clade 1 bacterium]